jgi:exonuclease SbcC
VDVLQDAPEQLAQVAADLDALGDPRRAYQRASDIAVQREKTEQQHARVTAQLADLAEQHQALTAQVAVWADLETRLSATRAERDTHAPDHQRYLQHEREAALGHERKAALDAVASELSAAQTYRDAQVAARDAIAHQYDKKSYADLLAQYGTLREELAGLAASLRHQQAQQAAVQETLVGLDAVQRDLTAAQSERDDLTEVQALLETLRQVLRDAGPAVTRALVEMISLHADQLFGEIMQGDGHVTPPHLRWTEDYDIILSRDGIERGFQQLSGGEQMAAALAVRLALLQEVSAVDVAFFDEPTANLDRDRRANLARQVLNIQGFGQLFVISHDDTFEQGTDFVVKVEKVNGESRVGV